MRYTICVLIIDNSNFSHCNKRNSTENQIRQRSISGKQILVSVNGFDDNFWNFWRHFVLQNKKT